MTKISVLPLEAAWMDSLSTTFWGKKHKGNGTHLVWSATSQVCILNLPFHSVSPCSENAWVYISATAVVLWFVVWLYRDSLEIENITDKYVFVTGCDSGFGNLLCKKLDRKGFRVLAGCLTEKGADDLKRVAGPYLKTVLLDVTNQDSIQKAMEWTKKEVGEKGEMFCGVAFISIVNSKDTLVNLSGKIGECNFSRTLLTCTLRFAATPHTLFPTSIDADL